MLGYLIYLLSLVSLFALWLGVALFWRAVWRNYYAGQALCGILSFPGKVDEELIKTAGSVSRVAYGYADAMLLASKQPKD